MLLDEAPSVLIHECIGNFNIAPDRAALTRITTSLSTLQQARSLRLSEAHHTLSLLNRTYNTLQQQHDVERERNNAAEHASNILELDRKKFRLAKEASDLEAEGGKLEVELGTEEGRLRELEAQGAEGGGGGALEKVEEQAMLKLKLYRSLGIDVEADGTGPYSKAIVRNVNKGYAEVVNLDPRYSKVFQANQVWQAI